MEEAIHAHNYFPEVLSTSEVPYVYYQGSSLSEQNMSMTVLY